MVGRELGSATHRCRNCKTAALFAFAAKQLHFSSSSCQRCDLDRNGKLDYQEFKAMIFRSRERKEALLREEQEQARKMSDLASSNEITTFLFIFLLIHGDSNFMFQAKLKGRRKSVGKKKKKVPTNKKKEKKEKKGAKKKK